MNPNNAELPPADPRLMSGYRAPRAADVAEMAAILAADPIIGNVDPLFLAGRTTREQAFRELAHSLLDAGVRLPSRGFRGSWRKLL